MSEVVCILYEDMDDHRTQVPVLTTVAGEDRSSTVRLLSALDLFRRQNEGPLPPAFGALAGAGLGAAEGVVSAGSTRFRSICKFGETFSKQKLILCSVTC